MNNDKERLKKCIQELLTHKKEIDNLSKVWSTPLNIKEGILTKENLHNILLSSIQARAGPALNTEKCKNIFIELNKKLDINIIKKLRGQKKLDHLYNTFNQLPYIGTKITLVILKDIIYCNKICNELVDLLPLPIDRHIRNILINKLKVFDENEVPQPSEPITTKRNKKFQEIIDKIHRTRVEFDYLWYIGYTFCSKRVACHLCWIKDYCQEKSFGGSNLNLK